MVAAAVVAMVIGLLLPSPGGASQLIDRNAKGVRLTVNAKGEALVSYRTGSNSRHVLAWGAINAIPPTRSRPQVAFKLDYAGGWGKYHRPYWRSVDGSCRPYDGPPLAWLVAACKAPDGSYWALQSWQRMLPNYGAPPTPAQAAWELRLSHWTRNLPMLTIMTDWSWHQWDHLFGTFSYDGHPVFGFRSTATGVPLDTFGRNIYVDTFNSTYGVGWRRENSFLAHSGTGAFCYSFNPHGSHPAGKGSVYRATVEGPGVTPDVLWQGRAPGSYDPDLDAAANELERGLDDRRCLPN
ncbi:MAG TPA: hypothetical protein VFJ93_09845 [Gaiellaceae bacterium]|nr:hypothetical protein [Gaiellaceae bacterium]